MDADFIGADMVSVRMTIQGYGIDNHYTGHGVIRGLLHHGPHNVRDVLATHILKPTGSYERANYAVQDTPDMVAKHYGRFLTQDKAAIAIAGHGVEFGYSRGGGDRKWPNDILGSGCRWTQVPRTVAP